MIFQSISNVDKNPLALKLDQNEMRFERNLGPKLTHIKFPKLYLTLVFDNGLIMSMIGQTKPPKSEFGMLKLETKKST